MKVEITYITQVRVTEWVEHENGHITDAGPMLRLFKGGEIGDIRNRKMVLAVREVVKPAPTGIEIVEG